MDQHHFDQEDFPPQDYEREANEYSRSPLSGAGGNGEESGFWQKLGLADRSGLWRIMGALFVIVALTILAVTIWRFANSSKKDLIPVIAPPAGPMKERPADPGGLQIMSDDFGGPDDESNEKIRLAPPPEVPDRHLLEEQHEAVERHRLEEQKRAALEKERQAKVAEEAKRQKETAAQVKAEKQAQAQAKAKAEKVKVKVADEEVAGEFDLDSRISSLANHPKKEAVTVSDSDLSALHAALANARGGHFQVQFAAYLSKNDALAKWKLFKSKDMETFEGHSPLLTETVKNGRVLIRLRTDGFASAAEAKRFCQVVQVSSIPCTPVAS